MSGVSGSVEGTTRSAYDGRFRTDAQPTPGALRTVWYRWTGRAGDSDVHCEAAHHWRKFSMRATAIRPLVSRCTTPPTSQRHCKSAATASRIRTVRARVGPRRLLPPPERTTSSPSFPPAGTARWRARTATRATGRFTLSWVAGNQTPTALDDTVETPIDTPVVIAVLGNDTDADGDALAVSSFETTTEQFGGVERFFLVADRLLYTPPSGFTGVDHFTYEVDDDGAGETGLGRVTVYVGVRCPHRPLHSPSRLRSSISVPCRSRRRRTSRSRSRT